VISQIAKSNVGLFASRLGEKLYRYRHML